MNPLQMEAAQVTVALLAVGVGDGDDLGILGLGPLAQVGGDVAVDDPRNPDSVLRHRLPPP